MCGISASFNSSKLNEIAKLNTYRGNWSYSVALYKSGQFSYQNFKTPFNFDLESEPNQFTILHMRAPTTSDGLDGAHYHPAHSGPIHLWHNGIIKTAQIKKLQETQSTDEVWDTALIAEEIRNRRFDCLSEIDGSFACLLYDERDPNCIYLFRTDSCPLFIDKERTISSTVFDGSYSVPSGMVYKLNLNPDANLDLQRVSAFKPKDDPYFFL